MKRIVSFPNSPTKWGLLSPPCGAEEAEAGCSQPCHRKGSVRKETARVGGGWGRGRGEGIGSRRTSILPLSQFCQGADLAWEEPVRPSPEKWWRPSVGMPDTTHDCSPDALNQVPEKPSPIPKRTLRRGWNRIIAADGLPHAAPLLKPLPPNTFWL